MRVLYRVGDESRTVDVDAAFFAVGWPGNADLVDAAAAGVATERGYVTVDAFTATNVPHIFAAGDVDGNSMLVSSAALEGRVAAENAVLGPRRRVVHEIVPVGSFTDPEYGSVGLTEEQARARYDCAVAVARYEDMLRPVADGQPEGFCKLIVETARRQIVGAHVLGEYSAEVIQMVAACMAAGMRVEEVAELQFAFPTFTEGVSQAAQMVVNKLGVRPLPHLWSSLSSTPSGPGMTAAHVDTASVMAAEPKLRDGSPQFLHRSSVPPIPWTVVGQARGITMAECKAGQLRPQEGRQVFADHQGQAAAAAASRTQEKTSNHNSGRPRLPGPAGRALIRLCAPAQVAGLMARRVAGCVEHRSGRLLQVNVDVADLGVGVELENRHRVDDVRSAAERMPLLDLEVDEVG